MGMRRINVSGKVYAFDRTNGALRWHSDVPNQMLIVEQFNDMPILMFTNQYNRMINAQRGQQVQCTSVKSIDKRTGKLLWDKEYQNNGGQNYYFYWLNNNPRAGVVELVSYNLKIIHFLDGNEPAGRVEAPAGQPGGQPVNVGGRVIIRRAIRGQVVPGPVPIAPAK
jgi:outer membrane protein assembly factor BamB